MGKDKPISLKDNDEKEIKWLEEHKQEIHYKDMTMVVYPNKSYGRKMKSVYLYRGEQLLQHYLTSKYFDIETKGMEQLKFQYQAHLEQYVLNILKEKARKLVIEPSIHNDPYIEIDLDYESVSVEEWDKVKELFNL